MEIRTNVETSLSELGDHLDAVGLGSNGTNDRGLVEEKSARVE